MGAVRNHERVAIAVAIVALLLGLILLVAMADMVAGPGWNLVP